MQLARAITVTVCMEIGAKSDRGLAVASKEYPGRPGRHSEEGNKRGERNRKHPSNGCST